MNRTPLLLVILLLCSSCYSYHIYPKAFRHPAPADNRSAAYVLNPDLQKEYEILSASGIFNLVADSTVPLKIKLYPIRKFYTCGQGVVLSFFTVGQIPVSFPDHYYFKFDATDDSRATRNFEFDLQIAQRIWFWDMFVPNKNFKQKAGKALLGTYRQQLSD